jgi:DNA polymerase-3 subunit delta'
MSSNFFLPWHTEMARHWLAGRERFAHAWLIHGPPGIGKERYARAAATSLLCEQPVAQLACGACLACGWVSAGNHPDLRLIRPESVAAAEGDQMEVSDTAAQPGSGAAKRAPSKDIRIDQIRSLSSWFNTATHRSGWRVAVLYPAQALNLLAANALLKVLEEPPPATVFLLVADAPDRLLPTLLSRCRRLPLAVPKREQAQAWLTHAGIADGASWLAAAGGAPLAAQRLAAQRDTPMPAWADDWLTVLAQGGLPDNGSIADTLEKVPAAEWLDTLQRVLVDLSLVSAGQPIYYFPDLAEPLSAIAARSSLAALTETARAITQQRRLANHPLNPKLFAHVALARAAAACR